MKIRTNSDLVSESYLPTWKRWECGEFVKLKLRDLKSFLISHVILWMWPFCLKDRIHAWWFPCKSRRWNRLSISFSTSSDKFPCTISSQWVSACSTLIPRVKHSLKCRWRIGYCTWTVKNVSGVPSKFHVSHRRLWSRLGKDLKQLPIDWERGKISTANRFHILKLSRIGHIIQSFQATPVFVNQAPALLRDFFSIRSWCFFSFNSASSSWSLACSLRDSSYP